MTTLLTFPAPLLPKHRFKKPNISWLQQESLSERVHFWDQRQRFIRALCKRWPAGRRWHPGIFASPPPQTLSSDQGVLEKQVVLWLFHTILHPANYQTGLSALILQLSNVNTKQYKPLALLKVSQHVINVSPIHGGLRANIKIKIRQLNHFMNVPYLHFWHLLYSNSEPAGGGWLGGRQRGVELEDDLVFEASVEIFMWEDDGVENYHLRRDVDVTTWGQKIKTNKKTKAVWEAMCFT